MGFYLFKNQQIIFNFKWVFFIDMIVKYDFVDVVNFMLNNDGVVVFEFDMVFFVVFVKVVNSNVSMVNNIVRYIVVNREVIFFFVKSSVLNRVRDDFWIVYNGL